jgi:hypothetical protein
MTTRSAKVRGNLGHPVIDADGHWTELYPVFCEFIDETAGAATVDTFRSTYGHRFHTWYELTAAERERRRLRRPVFWGHAHEHR